MLKMELEMTSTAKLHIDLSQGAVTVEGDPALVREIYNDFKGRLVADMPKSGVTPGPKPAQAGQTDSDAKPRAKHRALPRKKHDAAESGSGVSPNVPKLDKTIDTSGLAAVYGLYEPKNNSEKILIFAKYLIDNLGIEEPNIDQLYTMFKKTGDKIPKAFAQAFHDTGSKHGFIDFNGTAATLKVTIAGDNHFNHDLKKKTSE